MPLSGRLAVLPTTRPVLTRPLPTSQPRQKPWLLPLLAVFVLVNLALMFFRSYHLRLDGDITPIVLPRADYAHILQDPFGWSVLKHQSIYAGTNRFFAHMAMRLYWRNVPLFLQAFMNPVASLYVAQAIFNTTVEALLLYVMGWYATGTRRLASPKLWLAMALMIPFFQTTGYNRQMAIMDNAVTYNFYYPLPLLLLLVLLWPLYQAVSQRQPLRLSALKLVSMLLLAVVLSFNGPIITGVVLVMLLGVGVYTASQRWRWPVAQWLRGLSWQAVLLWGWFGVLCLYSLYIGRNNSENLTTTTVSLGERYHLMPIGIYNTLTARLGMPLLVLSCLANVWLVRRLLPPSAEGRRLGPTLRWVGLFAATYTLLLPLGGYRPYRPFILHHDCIVPITVGLVIFYGLSTARLLMELRGKAQRWYIGAAIIMVAIYINADRRLYKYGDRIREHHSLHLLAQPNAPAVVRLPEECTLLSWDPIPDPVSSLTSAEMLRYWRVTNGLKLYYYLPPQENLGAKQDE